jgi:hypothetical protein
MSIGHFRCCYRDAAYELATNPEKIKYRLIPAILNNLVLANVPDSDEVPDYFKAKHQATMAQVSTKTNKYEGSVMASLHGKHGKTLSKLACEIITLQFELEEYIHNDFIPS